MLKLSPGLLTHDCPKLVLSILVVCNLWETAGFNNYSAFQVTVEKKVWGKFNASPVVHLCLSYSQSICLKFLIVMGVSPQNTPHLLPAIQSQLDPSMPEASLCSLFQDLSNSPTQQTGKMMDLSSVHECFICISFLPENTEH